MYMLLCRDDYLYKEITWNLKKRLTEHNRGDVLVTRNRRPVKLVYKEIFRTRKKAAKREKEIKGWSRKKKERLISSFNLV